MSEDSDWEAEALQVLQVSRHHLLWQGVSGGGLAQARLQLRPRDGHRVRGEGQGGGGRQGHQDGGENLPGKAIVETEIRSLRGS